MLSNANSGKRFVFCIGGGEGARGNKVDFLTKNMEGGVKRFALPQIILLQYVYEYFW